MTNAIAALNGRRIFFLGVNTGFVIQGRPDEQYVDFYARRSSPDLYCVIVGNVVVPGGFGSNAVTPAITGETVWADLAATIRTGGSVPGIQLATTWQGYVGSRKFVATNPDDVISQARQLVAEMGVEQIGSILDAFDTGTDVAVQHGFRHIQIHAAHGYLLGLLVDQRINRDAARVLERLTTLGERLRRAGIETSIRISLRTGDAHFDSRGAVDFQNAIAHLPFDYVDLSSGFYNIDKRLIYPARPDTLATRLDDSLALAARHPGCRFILSGRAMRHNWAEFPPNMHVGLCRDLIANPKFLREPGNGCHNHNKCHYFSRGQDRLTCARWAEMIVGEPVIPRSHK
jgi:2,4-dienoyl-CoA reductase-like NADH-dependent reductase (Old Yellow Enzyme family)